MHVGARRRCVRECQCIDQSRRINSIEIGVLSEVGSTGRQLLRQRIAPRRLRPRASQACGQRQDWPPPWPMRQQSPSRRHRLRLTAVRPSTSQISGSSGCACRLLCKRRPGSVLVRDHGNRKRPLDLKGRIIVIRSRLWERAPPKSDSSPRPKRSKAARNPLGMYNWRRFSAGKFSFASGRMSASSA